MTATVENSDFPTAKVERNARQSGLPARTAIFLREKLGNGATPLARAA
jgi:hypothetical protein